MRIQTFDIGTWLYPDSEITMSGNIVELDSARNSETCFQILTDMKFEKGASIRWELCTKEKGIHVIVSELRPSLVRYNSGAQNHNAIDWDNVKDFVLRKAPYEIYDFTRPIDDGQLWGNTGYTGLFVQLKVDKEVTVGKKQFNIKFTIEEQEFTILVMLNVHKAVLCEAKDSPYAMGFWLAPNFLCHMHGVKRYSEEYYYFVELYLKQMTQMRCNHIQLPTPMAIRDENRKVVDFDFTEVNRYTEIALKHGFQYINSGFVAKWISWKDDGYVLRWDEETATESLEGYRQLKLYIKKTKEYVEKYKLQDKYWQSFVDEPQLQQSMAYKSLSSTFRREMPEMKLMDPVETPYVAGSCDVWVVKQAIYEKYKESYQVLQSMGEKLWVYSCGFPAGKWMNHIMDLPLAATRLINWKGIAYGINGFLHYGYMEVQEDRDPMYDVTFSRMFQKEMRHFPPGNGTVIYTDRKVIYDSVRAHVHRTAAAEAELFMKLKEYNPEACNEIIGGVCTTFEEYVSDSEAIEQARKTLLETMDVYL